MNDDPLDREGEKGRAPSAPPFEDRVESAPEVAEDDGATTGDTEADILRSELERSTEKLEQLEAELREAEERYLRKVAELDTMRRRMQGEVQVAHADGIDTAVAPALHVFDDLERALDAADRTEDPGSIVPGVRAVRDTLLRNLASLGIERVGLPGERFDPHLHEALTVVPLREGAQPGTIDQVFEAGFTQGERLVRVARVTVFAEEDAS